MTERSLAAKACLAGGGGKGKASLKGKEPGLQSVCSLRRKFEPKKRFTETLEAKMEAKAKAKAGASLSLMRMDGEKSEGRSTEPVHLQGLS